MTIDTIRALRLRGLRAPLLAVAAVCLLQAPAAGQSADDLKNAVVLIQQYKAEVGNMRAAVRQPLGPYALAAECTWCSSSFIGICTENTTQRYSGSVNFSGTRAPLDAVLSQAEQSANRFPQDYAPTQAWIDGLPNFSKTFDANADRILAIQQEIKSGSGPTADQRLVVKTALQGMNADLGRSAQQLGAGSKALAQSLQRQSGYRDAIRQSIGGADKSAQDELARLRRDATSKLKPDCLDNLVRNHFDPIRQNFSNSIQAISAAFQKLEMTSQAAERGLATLLGAVVNAQTDLKAVSDMVNAAQNAEFGSFIERLQLTAAKKKWKDLAERR
jgi:hypothetical protein